MLFNTHKSSDFANVAVALLDVIENFKSDNATVVALTGELGAGKTTLTQYLAKALGIEETIQSPTFVIMKFYPLLASPKLSEGGYASRYSLFAHIDSYRIEKIEEMQVLGLHKLIADPKNLILIEWPENISELLPDKRINVKIDYDGEGRKVEISKS